jgi:hypothetical protein
MDIFIQTDWDYKIQLADLGQDEEGVGSAGRREKNHPAKKYSKQSLLFFPVDKLFCISHRKTSCREFDDIGKCHFAPEYTSVTLFWMKLSDKLERIDAGSDDENYAPKESTTSEAESRDNERTSHRSIKGTIEESRALMENSRVTRLASITSFAAKSKRRAAAAKAKREAKGRTLR